MTESTTADAAASGTVDIGDVSVRRLGFGTMRLTGKGVWGPPADHDESIQVLRRAVELGVTFIDTADSYGPYVAEELIREALHPYPDDVLIATKAGLLRTGPDIWVPLGNPSYLRQEVEMSLRRLGLERIDLLQLHRVDKNFPLEDQVGELANDEGRRQDPPHRPIRSRCRSAQGRTTGHADRVGPEPVQPGQPRCRARPR